MSLRRGIGLPGAGGRTALGPGARRVLAVGLLALGAVAGWRIPVRTFPEPRYPTVGIELRLGVTESPEAVTRRWVIPLEGILREVGGVTGIVGTVDAEGAVVTAELEPGTDVEGKTSRLAGPLRSLRRRLPEGSSLGVSTATRSAGPVTAVAWVSGPRADEAAGAAADRLSRRPGVNSVAALGARERVTRVLIPTGHPDARRLVRQVRRSLEERLEIHPVGETIRGGRRVPVLWAPPDGWSLEAVPVATGDATLPLGALAKIETRWQAPPTRVRFEGRPARALVVRRESDASPLAVDAAIRRVLAETGAGETRAFLSWSEAEPLRELLVRGASALVLASALLAAAARWRRRSAAWAALAPLLGLAAAANLLWLARIPADTSTLPAALFGALAALTSTPARLATGGRPFLARAALLALLVSLVPLVIWWAGGELRWTLATPAAAFSLSAVATLAALFVLPAGGGRGKRGGSTRPLWRRPWRDPATVLLGALTGIYVLGVAAGSALDPEPRHVPRNPADLTVHLSLPPGGTAAETERDVEAVERFLASRPEVELQWSAVHRQDAFVFVELTPRGRRPAARARLETRLRAAVVTSALLDVTAGVGAAGGAGAGAGLGAEERLAPAFDAEGATLYRFILRGGNVDALQEAYVRITRRLGELGAGSDAVSGWDRPQVRLQLVPRPTVPAEGWLPWVRHIEDLASESRPLTLSRDPPSYLSVEVARGGGPFEPPRLETLLETAAAVEEQATGASLFRLEERLVHPTLARRDGRFSVPVTVRPRSRSEGVRREQVAAVARALRQVALPPGTSLRLPAVEPRTGTPLRTTLGETDWPIAIVSALLLLAAGAVWSGSLRVASLALAPAVPAVFLPAPWVRWTLGRADELTLLALAAAVCVSVAAAVDLLAGDARAPMPLGPSFRRFEQRAPDLLAAGGVAVLALLPLAASAEPLRSGWAVPAGAMALGLVGGVVGLRTLLPASVAALARTGREARREARGRTRPAAWTTGAGPARLEVRRLVKVYPGGHRALRGVSFALEPGIAGLLGPNGAGKTTLLRILVGLLQPTRGRVLYRGVAVDRYNQPLYRAHLGFLPQELNAYPGITGERFLDLWALEKGIRSPQRRRREVGRALELVELSEHGGRKVRDYSGGMRRRIGIAQALLGDLPLLVVDEPTAGMDFESRQQLRRILRRAAEGRVVVLSTHLIGDVDALADRLLFLYAGRLRYDGSQAAFLDRARGRVAQRVVPPEEVDDLASRFRVTRRVHVPGGVEVRLLAADPATLPADPSEPTLEEAYLVHLELAHRQRTSDVGLPQSRYSASAGSG